MSGTEQGTEPSRVEELKSEGNTNLQNGNYSGAVMKYSEALDILSGVAPDALSLVPVLYANRAMAHIKNEAYGLAIADAEAAIRADASYVKAYYRRGSANLAIGKYKLALKDFRAVCKMRPNDRDARQKLKECDKAAKQLAFSSAIESADSAGLSIDTTIATIETMVVDEKYDGPRLNDDNIINEDFVLATMERFRLQKLIHRKYVLLTLLRVRDILKSEASLVDLRLPSSNENNDKQNNTQPKFTICGDVHGQYYDLLKIFALNGPPSKINPYCFNGDFVDRGSFSFEVVFTLFAWKALCPHAVHLNRGNHETKNMTKIYGFEGEIKHKFDNTVLTLFHECFCALPLAACLESKIFIVHGGLSSDDDVRLDDVRKINRAMEPPDSGLMCDLLWSDPQAMPGRSPSKRGVGLSFGPDVTQRFLQLNDLSLVVRSHEVRDNGYEIEHDGNLITVFSAPNYCDAMGNKGAFITFGPDLKPKFTTYDAAPHPPIRPMAYASPTFAL
mmetsp:Transcript_22337/g.28891  ORF Transcript_22337/g.28891 Transcript_22337/m.28891 type:complete len:503 (-) Transcript_22337:319-1827(-)